MVLSWILQWGRLGISSGIRLGGAGVGQRPLLWGLHETFRIVLYFSIL
jgi:hypothetical protein